MTINISQYRKWVLSNQFRTVLNRPLQLKDADCIPRLVTEWKSCLQQLERMEVIKKLRPVYFDIKIISRDVDSAFCKWCIKHLLAQIKLIEKKRM